MVSPGVAATNYHVVEGVLPGDLSVTFHQAADPNPKPLAVNILYSDRQVDLALLQLDTDRPSLALADEEELRPGLPVAVIGCPVEVEGGGGKVNAVTTGRYLGMVTSRGNELGNVRDIAPRATFLRIDAYATHGNSGGPVVSLRTGKVIGVLQGMRPVERDEESRVCVPGRDLQKALNGLGPRGGWAVKSEAATAWVLYMAAYLQYAPRPPARQFDGMASDVTSAWDAYLRHGNRQMSGDFGSTTPERLVRERVAEMRERLVMARSFHVAARKLGAHLTDAEKNRLDTLAKTCERMADESNQLLKDTGHAQIKQMIDLVKQYREQTGKVCQSLDSRSK
jgi:hypothetical protein